jgi:hypothetical protein
MPHSFIIHVLLLRRFDKYLKATAKCRKIIKDKKNYIKNQHQK